MSLKKNILANYASQLYVTSVGIVMVPQYIKYMGVEAYGLVGFYAMLQAWFNLLDMGLTPTMARESARFNGGATSVLDYRRLARGLEGVFAAVGLFGCIVLLALAKPIATMWLNASALQADDITNALQLIAVIVALRWMCGLYRGMIIGAERLVWLSGFNSLIATGRSVLVLPILIYVSATPMTFFVFQLGVSLLELSCLAIMAYRLLPAIPEVQRIHWEWAPLKPVLKFSISIAFTSSVWVLVTQTDKLILSKLLPLAEYGYFTLAVLVAGGIMMISGPISGAVMPRMTKLEAKGDHAMLIRLYRKATQWVAILAGSVAITMAFFAEPLLWAWTGDRALAQQAAPILSLYALGNGILTVAAFPYYLQYAKGNLRLHLIGSAVFVLLLLPAIIWSTEKYGGVGAGYAWLGINLLLFIAWAPLVHHKFAPGLNSKWYGIDVLTVITPMGIFGYGLSYLFPFGASRGIQFFEIVLVGFVLLAVGILASSEIRTRLHELKKVMDR